MCMRTFNWMQTAKAEKKTQGHAYFMRMKQEVNHTRSNSMALNHGQGRYSRPIVLWFDIALF